MNAWCRFASCAVGLALGQAETVVTQSARFIPVLMLGLLLGTSSVTLGQIPVGHFTDIVPVLADPLYLDYKPTVTADGLTMIFGNTDAEGFSSRPESLGSFDLFMATRTNTEESFGNIVNLGPGINTSSAEFSGSISPDGQVLYFDAWNRSEGFGDYDLYEATRDLDGLFGTAINLGPGINSNRFEGGPSISTDELTVYYTDGPAVGSGQARLWSADRPSPDVPFGNAHDLGDTVNGSPGGEHRNIPSISTDERFLFYHIGPNDGLNDLWVSSRPTKEDPFGPPMNINDLWPGTEINTDDSEGWLHISRDWPAPGSKIYFTSNRASEQFWGFDIYQATWVPVPGDFDNDGDVDGADFLHWQLNDGSQSNLTVWQENFGIPSIVATATTAIPEPATILLAMLGMASVCCYRRRR